MEHPPIIDYENSDYQEDFWEKGGREYEDGCEAVALKRLLPKKGKLMLEIGAGAGRNTPRYEGFEQIILLDYSISQLQKAQAQLGVSERYIYVAGDVYKLPFAIGVFDAATMIRTMHHLADPPKALCEIQQVLQSDGVFILEFANKRNLKSIFRYLFKKQDWNPFSPEAVEFEELHFDFHPSTVGRWMRDSGFVVDRHLTVSHFRIGSLKKLLPTKWLVDLDSVFQLTGDMWQFTPSVFIKSMVFNPDLITPRLGIFRCPECNHYPLKVETKVVSCPSCSSNWAVIDGIFDFRKPLD